MDGSLYIIFAISVGLWACYELMRPAIQVVSVTDPEDVISQNKFIAYLVTFGISALIAPLMFVIILTPKLHDSVIDAFINKRD